MAGGRPRISMRCQSLLATLLSATLSGACAHPPAATRDVAAEVEDEQPDAELTPSQANRRSFRALDAALAAHGLKRVELERTFLPLDRAPPARGTELRVLGHPSISDGGRDEYDARPEFFALDRQQNVFILDLKRRIKHSVFSADPRPERGGALARLGFGAFRLPEGTRGAGVRPLEVDWWQVVFAPPFPAPGPGEPRAPPPP